MSIVPESRFSSEIHRGSYLALDIELVVKVAIDLLVLSVFLQETTQNAHPSHPQFLDRHTRVGGTLALTGTGVTSLSAGGGGREWGHKD